MKTKTYHDIRCLTTRSLTAVATLAALLLCTPSCTDDDGSRHEPLDTRVITFTAGVDEAASAASTRATISGSFEDGELIGVFATAEGISSAKPYRYNAANSTFEPATPHSPLYWPGNETKVKVGAYHPYGNGTLPYVQPEDQRSQEAFAAADFLIAEREIERGDTHLSFTHQSSHIIISLRAGREMNDELLKKATVTLPEIKVIKMDNVNENALSTGVKPATALIPHERAKPTDGYCRTVEALCHGDEAYTAGTELFRIVVAGKTYPYHLPADKTLDANTRYTYNVTVNDADITVTTTNDDIPWENTEALPAGYDLLIANEEQLRDFAEAVNSGGTINGSNGPVPAHKASVLQTADIVLDGTKPWTPIGINGGINFLGKYNGNGHTIKNMTIKEAVLSDSGNPNAGMFGSIDNAVLTGINLQNVTIDIGPDDTPEGIVVGSIIGLASQSTISLCSAIGKVVVEQGTSTMHAGGITGFCVESTISRCRAEVGVTYTTADNNTVSQVGGIAGKLMNGFILSCEAKGRTITAEAGIEVYAGGIVGENMNGVIAFCHAGESSIEIKGGATVRHAGGLIGANNGYLYSCYSRANVTAPNTSNAGAIVGHDYSKDRIQHCYGTGTSTPYDPDNIPAIQGNIVYNQNPAPDEIFDLMQGFKGEVVSIPSMLDPNATVYPTTTHYDPFATPAYGIEPIRVKWTGAAWKMGIDPLYPEIDMLYQGIPITP